MKFYKGDPRWINVRYKAKCDDCKDVLAYDERALYYPNGRHIYCVECGASRYAEFINSAQDEEVYNYGKYEY